MEPGTTSLVEFEVDKVGTEGHGEPTRSSASGPGEGNQKASDITSGDRKARDSTSELLKNRKN